MKARGRLILQLIIVTFFTIAFVVVINIFKDSVFSKKVIRLQLQSAITNIQNDIKLAIVDPFRIDLEMLKEWSVKGELQMDDEAYMRLKLGGILQRNKEVIQSYVFYDNKGNFFRILSDSAQTIQITNDTVNPQFFQNYLEKYDFHNVDTAEDKDLHNRDIIFFYADTTIDLKSRSILAVTFWDDTLNSGARSYVGMEINELAFFSRAIENNPFPRGISFFFLFIEYTLSESLTQVAVESYEHLDDSTSLELLHGILNHYAKTVDPKELNSFQFNGERWWSMFKPLRHSESLTWIAMAVPSSDLLQVFKQYRINSIIISAILVLLAGIIVFRLIRLYNSQLTLMRTTTEVDNALEKIKTTIKLGEGASVEFKSTMRMNLKAGKTGKEIEIAWLKGVVGFLNTNGGTLLIGVNDDGEFLGVEADNFENEDRCRLHFRNLINQHIGAEYSQYINMEIVVVDGKSVCLVECEPSKEPAFLKNKNEEEFYIRSGPASVKLSVSKVVSYIEKRKASKR